MIQLPAHDDVIFNVAPLDSVTASVVFNPVLSLMTTTGVAGLQEALRGEYPKYEEKRKARIKFDGEIGIENRPPVHRLTADDGWSVDATTTSVMLTALGSAYSTIEDFLDRFERLADATSRTICPGPTDRITLAKDNRLKHPHVKQPTDWEGLLSDVLVAPYKLFDSSQDPTRSAHGSGLLHLHGDDDVLELSHSVSLQQPDEMRITISSWTTRPYALDNPETIIDALGTFSKSATALFHSLLEEPMKAHLEPRPRPA